MPLNESELNEKLQLCEKAPQGPYFVGFDDAHDAPDHENSGLAMVDTGRADDWPIARLCEWNAARFIAAFDPTTCAELVREVLRLRQAMRDAKEDADSAAIESRWQSSQGEEYGTY